MRALLLVAFVLAGVSLPVASAGAPCDNQVASGSGTVPTYWVLRYIPQPSYSWCVGALDAGACASVGAIRTCA
jgi:hypothetical protein